MSQQEPDLLDLWQSFEPNPKEDPVQTIDLATLKTESSKLDRRVRRRNTLETAAAAVVAVWFGYGALTAETMLGRVGHAEIVLSALWIAFWLIRRGSPEKAPPPEATTTAFIEHRRRQLERQIELLRKVPLWYIAPLALGLLLVYVDGLSRILSDPTPAALAVAVLVGMLQILVCAGVVYWNLRAAAALKAELRKLSE